MSKQNGQLKVESSSILYNNRAHRPFLISGPCSAETEDQVMETARQLKALNKVALFRSGIWKPRTRPDSFEGVGSIGLPWLQRVKNEVGLMTTVEVAKAGHVEECLKHSIDVLWIGARTTVNPFAVQEISEALKGVNIPILIKNPINPDFALWLGAVERFEKAGIKEIGAIHRGFSDLSDKYYRNRPQWQIALEFKRQRPDLLLLNDPSHICGRRDILMDVAQKALDLNFDGLMIESHIDPDNAWSDASQQVTPETLSKMLNDLVVRSSHEDDAIMQSELEYFRREIDHIDDEIIGLLSTRMRIARMIGEYKKEKAISILQPKRWNEIIEKSLIQGSKKNLSIEFIRRLIDAIHDESIDHQEQVLNENKKKA